MWGSTVCWKINLLWYKKQMMTKLFSEIISQLDHWTMIVLKFVSTWGGTKEEIASSIIGSRKWGENKGMTGELVWVFYAHKKDQANLVWLGVRKDRKVEKKLKFKSTMEPSCTW